jgi:hypothetical protein
MIPKRKPSRMERRTERAAIQIVTQRPPIRRGKFFPLKRTLKAVEIAV